MLKRVKYISRHVQRMLPSELDELTSHAGARNERLGVTGVLVTSGVLFMQVLEGPAEAVDELIAAIRADPRHSHMLVLSDEAIDERVFADWYMERVDLDDERQEPLRAMLEAIVDQRRALSRLEAALERAVLREIDSRI
ncbi:MAG: BLUF domain-containing protein [Deltaproteobacteria bacterium]|nr:BLUF domain-containing protein [Deltaproteobacteria bacterium]